MVKKVDRGNALMLAISTVGSKACSRRKELMR